MTPPGGQCCGSGAAGVEDPDEQVFGADGVLVVGAGGAGGEDDHLAGLIGVSLERAAGRWAVGGVDRLHRPRLHRSSASLALATSVSGWCARRATVASSDA